MVYKPGWEAGSMKTLAAHGLAGGIVQDRMGGSFGAGLLSGALGSYLGSSGHSNSTTELIGNTVKDAIVGGTISAVGGGKFANGAQTGAFRYLFNEGMHAGQGLKVRFTGGDEGIDSMYDSGEAAYNELSEGKLALVKDQIKIYRQTPRGRGVFSQSGTLTIAPGSGNAPLFDGKGTRINFSGRGGVPILAHEIGHTAFGGGYVDYRGQGCSSCPVGNVRFNENAVRGQLGMRYLRDTYTETNPDHDYFDHMFWVR